VLDLLADAPFVEAKERSDLGSGESFSTHKCSLFREY
jgi:hypothetical protein